MRRRLLPPLDMVALGSFNEEADITGRFTSENMQGARFESGLDNSPMCESTLLLLLRLPLWPPLLEAWSALRCIGHLLRRNAVPCCATSPHASSSSTHTPLDDTTSPAIQMMTQHHLTFK
jgi:hypothetical protein